MDKYSALWVSHSSISDFLTCPRAYFLKNVYKDPKSGHKIQLISPPLALGQAVHQVIESLSVLPVNRRFETPLVEKLESAWQNVSGTRGGFPDSDVEQRYKRRAEDMLRRVTQHPGPLLNLAVKIPGDLPQYWISEEENIILCGKLDWLEYNEETTGIHIIDFKTGRSTEDENSLQLPIYLLLATNCQKHPVEKASYWYIDRDDEPSKQKLPDIEESEETILKVAKKMKLARQLGSFLCPTDGCDACKPYEAIVRGEGTLVGTSDRRQDIYMLEPETVLQEESKIL
ncbi:MAG: PD-(D/E)XK nuclease family protein [Candidatus Dojkabacteria bacterium]|nr:PD-(D/E)XK nuclease family protein [Candidatus Dojkabacteria bacterium]